MAERVLLHEGNRPSSVTIVVDVDLAPFRAALADLRAAVAGTARAFDGLVPVFARLAASFTGAFREHLVVRAAIERYGVTEADIRRVEGSTVVTWNRRRIEVAL